MRTKWKYGLYLKQSRSKYIQNENYFIIPDPNKDKNREWLKKTVPDFIEKHRNREYNYVRGGYQKITKKEEKKRTDDEVKYHIEHPGCLKLFARTTFYYPPAP